MAVNANMDSGQRNLPWRWMLWSLPLLLLLLPLVAMRFTNEVNWTMSDFLFAALLFGSVGIAIELVFRNSGSLAYRLGATIAVIASFLTIWVNGAVGMIGSEDNPYNLLFGGILLIALTGTILARFRATGMALAMVAAGVAQGAVSAFGFTADTRGATFGLAFMGLWLLSAALLRSSAGER